MLSTFKLVTGVSALTKLMVRASWTGLPTNCWLVSTIQAWAVTLNSPTIGLVAMKVALPPSSVFCWVLSKIIGEVPAVISTLTPASGIFWLSRTLATNLISLPSPTTCVGGEAIKTIELGTIGGVSPGWVGSTWIASNSMVFKSLLTVPANALAVSCSTTVSVKVTTKSPASLVFPSLAISILAEPPLTKILTGKLASGLSSSPMTWPTKLIESVPLALAGEGIGSSSLISLGLMPVGDSPVVKITSPVAVAGVSPLVVAAVSVTVSATVLVIVSSM